MQGTSVSRIEGVDVLRVAAIISVIAIHTVPFASRPSFIGHELGLATAINQSARFAVPLFFILSGYFWAQKCSDERDVYGPSASMAKRIGFLLLAWSIIYLLPTDIIDAFATGPLGPIQQLYWNLSSVAARPLDAVLQGTKVHLWFLAGLLWSLAISALMVRYKHERLLAAMAIALYLTGIAGKAYSDTPLGFHTEFNLRNGPFFSLIFFVTGYFLHRSKPSGTWLPTGLSIAALGVFLHFAELQLLSRNWATSMVQDYVIGTYLFGLGVAMIALANPRYLRAPRIASIGPLVLGIYTSHFIFVDLLKPLDRQFAGNWIWSISYVAAVFILSCALVRVLLKFNLTRKLVA